MVVLMIVVLLAIAALLVLFWAGLRERIRRQEQVREQADTFPTLEYEVPTGQDPAVIMVALRSEGYEATVDPAGRHPHVLVPCPAGTDRERAHVRSVVQSASVSALDDGVPLEQEVRFIDE